MVLAVVLRCLEKADILKRDYQLASLLSWQVVPFMELVRIDADCDEQQDLPRPHPAQPSGPDDDGAYDKKNHGAV